ncbi:MAG: fibrobacter succinogenes major paralogous domain-containing protein [Bacteroidota bacterium]
MNKKIYFPALFILSLGFCLFLMGSCSGDEKDENPLQNNITDIDGNVYHSITIGTQTWMVENLATSRYRNGDSIPQVTDSASWIALTTGACCYYDNSATSGTTYGFLYNWFAVNDPRNLAPEGWHVASREEWNVLNAFLGGELVSGGKLKETGTAHWNSPNTGATDEAGFKGLPGGGRSLDGIFNSIGQSGLWWTSTESSTTDAWPRGLSYNSELIFSSFWLDKNSGFSVRCIKDLKNP